MAAFNIDNKVELLITQDGIFSKSFRVSFKEFNIGVASISSSAEFNLVKTEINTDALLGLQRSGDVVKTTTSARTDFKNVLALQVVVFLESYKEMIQITKTRGIFYKKQHNGKVGGGIFLLRIQRSSC